MYSGDDIKEIIYSFFFAFSRFEYALKNSGFLRAGSRGNAEACWADYCSAHEKGYKPDKNVSLLLENAPKASVVLGNNLGWRELTFDEGDSEMQRVSVVVRTVRNNLFHGGKHGDQDWDDKERVRFLLKASTNVIETFASLNADVLAHYRNQY